MDILFSFDIFSYEKYGGISRYYVELQKHLNKIKYHDDNFTLSPGIHINEYIKDKGFKIYNFKGRSRVTNFFNIYNENILLKKSTNTIFHKTYYSNYNLDNKNPKILTIYDLIDEKFNANNNIVKKIIKNKIDLCNKVDKIIAISNSTKNDIITNYKINPNKIHVVYLGSNICNDIKLNQSYPSFEFNYFLFVGKRNGYKNFKFLLDIFHLSNSIKNNFKLVCFGSQPTLNELKIINEYKLDDNIIFITGNDNILANLYTNAFALVYPSLYEGFGLPIIEAMKLSCPVFCSNTSSMIEIADNNAFLFDPYEIDSFLSVFDKNSNIDNLSNKKNQARIYAQKFTWDQCALETRKIYNEI